MPTFKPKVFKKIEVSKKKITTLDSKHKEIVEDINCMKDTELPKLINKKKELTNRLKEENITIDEELDIKDQISQMKQNIKNIKKKGKRILSYKFNTYI